MSTPEQQAEELLRSLSYISSRGVGRRQLGEHHIQAFISAVAAALEAKDEQLRNQITFGRDQLDHANAEIEQWKLVKQANDNGLNAMIAQLRSQLAVAQGMPHFASLGQGAMITYVNGHYSVTIPTDSRWAELTYRKPIAVGHSPGEAIENAKQWIAQAERKG